MRKGENGFFTLMYDETHIEGESLAELEEIRSGESPGPSALLFRPYTDLLSEDFHKRAGNGDLFAVSLIDTNGIHRSNRNMGYQDAVLFIEESHPLSDDYVSIYLMESAIPYMAYQE